MAPEAGADGQGRTEEDFEEGPLMLLTLFRSLSNTALGSRGFPFGGYYG